jgi:3-hydroxyisobutyrate dehydrogenase
MSPPVPRVAAVGLGNMGLAMAARLAAQGVAVTAWNRSAGPRDAAAAAGCTAAPTPRAAVAGATHVVVSVADGPAFAAVAEGPDGFLDGLGPDAVVLAASTVAPAAVTAMAEAVRGRGASLVDAGVLGNPAHAADGQLRVYLGGADDAVARALPVAQLIGKEVRHVGPLGAGMRLKLVLNLVMGLEMQALAEAAALAGALGIDPAEALDVIGGSGFASPVMAFKARRMAAGRYDEPDFRLALMAKDLGIARAEAAAAGLDAPMTAAAAATHARAVERGLGALDCAAIAAAVADPAHAAEPAHA